MKPRVHPADEPLIHAAFHRTVNMSAGEIARWLETDSSRAVGQTRPGDSESMGRQSARRIIEILAQAQVDLTESDYVHMRKVTAFVARHGARRPGGDLIHSRWRWSLMNWGHDPLKSRADS